MTGIIYYGIFLLSIAFAIVVICIAFLVKRVVTTMESFTNTLGEVEKKLNYITPQFQQTIRESSKTLDDLGEKLKATDSVFDTIENVGNSVKSVNQMITNKIRKPDINWKKHTKPFIEGIKWSETASIIYSKWIKRNKPEKKELTIQRENTEIVPIQGNEG